MKKLLSYLPPIIYWSLAWISIFILISPVQANQQQMLSVISGMGTTPSGADETFDTNPGYDLTWTETDPDGFVDPDSTTHVVSGQSLYINQNLTGSENFIIHDTGTASDTKSYEFKLYLASLTLPADSDIIYFFCTSPDNTPNVSEGIAGYYTRISGVNYIRFRSGGNYTTSVAVAGFIGSFITIKVDYVKNGTSTVTINGTGYSLTTVDFQTRYKALGSCVPGSSDVDEVMQVYIEDVDGIL